MFLDLVKQARSHRGFRQDRKVTRQELEHLVECARFTPAARNDQVLKYYLAEKPETVAAIQPLTKWAGALAELHLPRKGAEPVAYIVICLDGSLAENPAPYQRDVGIVAQTMLLAAAEMGLNGCMIGSFAAGSCGKSWACRKPSSPNCCWPWARDGPHRHDRRGRGRQHHLLSGCRGYPLCTQAHPGAADFESVTDKCPPYVKNLLKTGGGYGNMVQS